MDSEFWVKAWKEGRTAFHQQRFNGKLLKFLHALDPQKGQNILVPLCGKTKDMVLFSDLGLSVQGVELYEQAVKEFFTENNFPTPSLTNDLHFKNYKAHNIEISVGDFFKLNKTDHYSLVYDRAALVALPKEMRKNYAEIVKRVLKKKGKYLLITFEYNPSEMDGPPFSVPENEVRELFHDFSIELLEAERPNTEGSRLSEVQSLREKVYLLKKS